MTMEKNRTQIPQDQSSYQQWRDTLRSNPDYAAVYEEEAARSALWLQLVEARQAAGLTQADVARRLGVSQAQVARIEKRSYDGYTLTTLRRYVQALGEGFTLQVYIRQPQRSTVASQIAQG